MTKIVNNESYLLYLLNKSNHVAILSIAIPLILSNITVPLLGIVDSAVIGQLEHASYLGAVAIGGNMINMLLWLFGFLRMSTTGVTAQAHGANDAQKQLQILLQGLIIAVAFSLIILATSKSLSYMILSFSDASNEIKIHAKQYFLIRVISCPAALINLVFIGWLLGRHEAKQAMWLLISINLINIILDLIFVPVLKMGLKGAAIASVIADYSGLLLGSYFILMKNNLPKIRLKFREIYENILDLLKLNFNLFIRNLFLQFVFSFMIFKGASFGDNIAAANAILMNFLLFISYVMDGFANTIEALVGKSLGSNQKHKLNYSLIIIIFWSLLISLIYIMTFAIFGEKIINFMSSIDQVRSEAKSYLPWIIFFPLISIWSFLLDGIFIGATLGKEMRNSMIISCLIYFVSYGALHEYDNNALWASMSLFMTMRWVILAYILKSNKILNK